MEFICQFIQLDRKLRVVDGFSNTINVEKKLMTMRKWWQMLWLKHKKF